MFNNCEDSRKQPPEQGSGSRQKSIAKKRRALLDESDSDDGQPQQMGAAERRQMETDVEHVPKPTWQRDEHLSTLPEVWQEDLYHENMNKLKRKEDAMVTERAVLMLECTALGIVECFQRLGWEAALTFRDEDGQDKIPMKAVIGWMATLRNWDQILP
ncbi:hypothetical protein E3N88_33223 [Mikania micrantha]|uniref:Uncharacterized protein n=1 Tax=Mikania micrantha TaxID=192012 RepID=A0A5N6MBD2_9ASTR|nr:hypothetical protein E3N88_33223 [Mikania micrantha]